MPSRSFARILSIAGHPALLMPCGAVWATATRGAPPAVVLVTAAASLAVVLGVGVYSLQQVRAGRWVHMDASMPGERRELNLFLALLLFGIAAALWALSQPPAVAAGLALGGAVVAVGHLLRARLKVSLHVAFAVLAASLLWPHVPALCAAAVLSVGVAWSRVILGRHTVADVLAGWAVGAAAGAAFQAIVFRLPGL